MRFELWIIIITALFIVNAYYDNFLTNIYSKNKKYVQIVTYGLIGLAVLYYFRTNPKQSKEMVYQASNVLKFLPIDRNATNLLNPMINMCKDENESSIQKIVSSGKNTTKRSVSETKKKWVASHQDWKCAECKEKLPAWFEVDHIQRLADGGTNDVNNLVAYCRSCHGKKTMMENF